MIQGKSKFLFWYIIPVFSSIGMVNKVTGKVDRLFNSWSHAAKWIQQEVGDDQDEVQKMSDQYDLQSITGIKRLRLIVTLGYTKPLSKLTNNVLFL